MRKRDKTLQYCFVEPPELLVAMFDQKSKLHPTLDRTKNVGRTSSNMGGQTVEQCWIEQSWSVESNFVGQGLTFGHVICMLNFIMSECIYIYMKFTCMCMLK